MSESQQGPEICDVISRKRYLWEQKKVFIRKAINSHRIGKKHQHGRHFNVSEHLYGRRFNVSEHLYGRRDVMWKCSIVLCPLRVGKIWWGSVGK